LESKTNKKPPRRKDQIFLVGFMLGLPFDLEVGGDMPSEI
jgi:hypothetical protein